jgi:hypothetical protein
LPSSERLLNGLLEVFERALVPFAERRVLRVEAALEQKIRQGLEEVFGFDSQIFAGIAGIVDVS